MININLNPGIFHNNYRIWLADKVYDVVKGEDMALKALSVTEEELKINPKRKNKIPAGG